MTFWRKCGTPRRNPINRRLALATRLHEGLQRLRDSKVRADHRETSSGGYRDDRAPLILHLHAGRLRVGYFLLCAGVALYGGWHWFGSSGLALVALWLDVRLKCELAPVSGDFSLRLDQVARVRVDPWRVTVAFSTQHLTPAAAMPEPAQTAVQAVYRRRIDFFRDELDASQWSELRRRLLAQMSPQRKPVARVTAKVKV